MRQFIQGKWKYIKKNSYKNRTGYNPEFIMKMIYDEINILVEKSTIKSIILEIRYDVKKYRLNRRRRRERLFARI